MSDREDLSHYIPRTLDAVPKFLFWEMDVAAIAMVGILLGIAVGYTFTGIIVGICMAFAYSKLKSGKHPGMAAHLLYWTSGTPKTKELPESHIRELNG